MPKENTKWSVVTKQIKVGLLDPSTRQVANTKHAKQWRDDHLVWQQDPTGLFLTTSPQEIVGVTDWLGMEWEYVKREQEGILGLGCCPALYNLPAWAFFMCVKKQ